VARFVSFNGQPARIPEKQIQGVYRVLQHDYEPVPYSDLIRGDEVEIVSGPLRGLCGIYIEDRGKHQLVLSVDVIQQAVAITVDRGQIRRI
jgi:transcription antitermination factor NusG